MREHRVRHQPATTGHEAPTTGAYLTELKLPAVGDYIVVAKRAAASLGLVVGVSVLEIAERNIAIAEACEGAIDAATQQGGRGAVLLRLIVKSRPGGREAEARSA